MRVLVKTNTNSNTSVYHIPSEADETVPKCGIHKGDMKDFARKDKSCVPNHRPCKRCTGEAKQGGWAARGKQ